MMDNIKKYLKIAKEAVIKSEDKLEDKIINRISHIDEKDNEELLDDNFRDFFSKSNSKPYILEQRIKTHPGVFVIMSIMLMGIIAFLVYITKMALVGDSK
ncbi:MAG TPA: hypothetical protein DCP02_02080 [Actinobacteria bacterium]|nr:hypothetical protein [Actinomycetota bacterium]